MGLLAMSLPEAKVTYGGSIGYDWNYCSVYYSEFSHAVEGLDLPPLDKGYVEITCKADGESWSMPYGSYSEFRDELARIVYPNFNSDYQFSWDVLQPGDPFYEMVDMSDCEGFFSNLVCKKISSDFEQYRDRFDSERYEKWAGVFKEAADNNGVVIYL